jgi:hypothetical protein
MELENRAVEGIRVRIATPAALYQLKKGTVRPLDRQDAEALRRRFAHNPRVRRSLTTTWQDCAQPNPKTAGSRIREKWVRDSPAKEKVEFCPPNIRDPEHGADKRRNGELYFRLRVVLGGFGGVGTKNDLVGCPQRRDRHPGKAPGPPGRHERRGIVHSP